jgi:hypothetical protein
VLAQGERQHLVEQFLLARVHDSGRATQQERAVLHADAEGTHARVLVAGPRSELTSTAPINDRATVAPETALLNRSRRVTVTFGGERGLDHSGRGPGWPLQR